MTAVHSLLREEPDCVRLLKSAQAALPMTAAFWDDLSRGLGIAPERLAHLLERLQGEGLVAGAWGEPNPASPDFRETLHFGNAPPAQEDLVRWRSDAVTSILSRDNTGWPAQRWWKVGTLPDWNLGEPRQLLAASTDRTSLVPDEQPAAPSPPSAEERAVLRLLSKPLRLAPPQTPWDGLGEQAAITPEQARRAVASLILSRRWRRFALRLNLHTMGWRGCGLACWRIEDDQAPRAAQALARIRGTGDVTLRRPTADWPFNLIALLIAADDGAGEHAARLIGEQWGREPGRWLPLALE